MQMPTTAVKRAAGSIVLAVLVAACSAPAATPKPAPTTSAAPSAAVVSVVPGSSAEATTAGSVVAPSLGASTVLTDVLPAELGGSATQRLAVSGADLSSFDASTAVVFESIIRILGVDASDMAVGIATNSSASVIAFALRVPLHSRSGTP